MSRAKGVNEAIKRLREPYTYAYGDSGDAHTDGNVVADAYDEAVRLLGELGVTACETSQGEVEG